MGRLTQRRGGVLSRQAGGGSAPAKGTDGSSSPGLGLLGRGAVGGLARAPAQVCLQLLQRPGLAGAAQCSPAGRAQSLPERRRNSSCSGVYWAAWGEELRWAAGRGLGLGLALEPCGRKMGEGEQAGQGQWVRVAGWAGSCCSTPEAVLHRQASCPHKAHHTPS